MYAIRYKELVKKDEGINNNMAKKRDKKISCECLLWQQNLFLLISARITIYDIVISYQAEIDLRGIFEYIAFELKSPENASGQLDRLEACILSCSIYSG